MKSYIRRDLLIAFFAITFFLAFVPIFTYAYFASSLSSKESLTSHNDTGLILLDRDNRPFFSFYSAKFKRQIPLSEIPNITREAVISMEDKDFYSHPGFSVGAMARSLIADVQKQDLAYGGSTLTQQLVKNSLLNPRKDFLRKYQELILAGEVERRYNKDEILEMYLNSVYFGEGAFGLEEAAHTYFNKEAKDLDLAESSILAAILPAPSRLSLLNGDLDEAQSRQAIILRKMKEQGFITEEQENKAEEEKLKIAEENTDINTTAPHFALMIRDELINAYGEETVARSGFKVRTSLNLDLQKTAEKVVADQVNKLKANRVSNGAAVALNPKTGEILAMVGSSDWYNQDYGKVNIVLSERPPGSSFKPIIYIRAFERNLINPSTILHDQPTKFANFDEAKYYASFQNRQAAEQALKNDPQAFYSPLDFDRKFRGSVTVRRALSNSLNIPAVEVMKKVGVEDGLDFAKSLGLTTLKSPENYGLSLVLGTANVKLLEMAKVYGTFANNGAQNEPEGILQITDKTGRVIKTFEPKPKNLIDPKYTFLISSILSDNHARAEEFGNALTISRPAAVKTGTTEDFKDAWTIGYTPSLVVGVWVGNNYGASMDNIAGSLGAAPIWKAIMEKGLTGTSIEAFTPPSDIVKVAGCIATTSATQEYFIKGTEPKAVPCNPSPTPGASSNPTASPPPTSPEPQQGNQKDKPKKD